MAATLRTVVGVADRPVHVRAGRDALDRPVRWVAVSELEDPTPYLEGGELLLTTGIRLTPEIFDAYVARLVEAGVAALGLGVGLTYPSMPDGLVVAAERYQLPLLEVPEPTPFIAISKAVSSAVAATEYEAVTRAVEAQRELTRAALAEDAAPAVVGRLAKQLSASVLLLGADGAVLRVAPDAAEAERDAVAGEVERLRSRGARASAAFTEAGRSVVIQPLAPAGELRGHLVAVRPTAFAAADHTLMTVAVALLSLTLERPSQQPPPHPEHTDELGRLAAELLLDGQPVDRLPMELLGWSDLSQGPVQVLLAAPDEDRGSWAAQLRRRAPWPLVEATAGVIVVSPADPTVVEGLVQGAGAATWGISEPHELTELSLGVHQATRALAAASSGQTCHFGDLAGQGVVALVAPDAGRGFADALLGPLEERGRGDLVASVRAWLAHHGQWDAAATSLGVHRHTLRYRMNRVEELLGRTLDDPDLRADLWVALRLRDQDVVE